MRSMVLLLMSGLMLGCGTGDVRRNAVVRDSAGVRIVENDLTATLPAYVIGEDALVEIGVVEGGEPYMLDNVRRARWLDGGFIAVLNGGTNEIRVFDEDGRHIRTYGRRGGGPGEYTSPIDFWHYADSLIVLELGEVTVVSLEDGSVRTLAQGQLPGERPYRAEAWFDDGEIILPIQAGGMPAGPDQWIDISIDYVRLRLDGSPADTVVSVPGGRLGMVPFRTSAGGEAVLITNPLFGGRAHATVYRGLLYAGPSFRPRIGVYDAAGMHIRDIRWNSPGQPVTSERLEAHIESVSATYKSPNIREEIERMIPADTFPYFDHLLTDDEGRLLVRSFDLPGEVSPAHWTVFDTAGIAEAVIEMPRDLTVYEVRRDRVLAMRTDSLGVQQVVVLPIRLAN